MVLLISVVLVVLGALGLKRLLPAARKHRRQVRFIRETLASSRKADCRRVIVSLSTLPDRMNNLRPTIRSLLEQTHPPDEIVLPFRNFRFGNSGLMSCRNIFPGCRACVFCVAPRIGGQQRSLSARFRTSWQRGARIR